MCGTTIAALAALLAWPLAARAPVLKTLIFPAERSITFLCIFATSSALQDFSLNSVIRHVSGVDFFLAYRRPATCLSRLFDAVGGLAGFTPVVKLGFLFQAWEVRPPPCKAAGSRARLAASVKFFIVTGSRSGVFFSFPRPGGKRVLRIGQSRSA